MDRLDRVPVEPVLPSYFRKFRFKFRFHNTQSGQVADGSGEIAAMNYIAAMCKCAAFFSDSPGRVLTLFLEDITDEKIIKVG